MRSVRRIFVHPLSLAILAFAALLIPALAGAGGERVTVGDWQDEEFPNLMLHPDSVVYHDNEPAGLPADVGEWALPISWPADAVHMMPLYTGQVLFFRGDETSPTSYTWNPVTGQILSQSVSKIIWCGGHNFLPDGRVLLTGGAVSLGTTLGPRQTFIFDPVTTSWTRMPDMRRGRYYPTNVSLGDGRTLVFAGTDETGANNDLVEAYVVGGGPGGTDIWNLLTGATKALSYYPRMHVLPNGEIANVGPDTTTRILDPATQTWRNSAGSLHGNRSHGTSIALPPSQTRIMILGGHNRSLPDPLASNTTEIIDLNAATPQWSYGAPMHFRRMHLMAVNLPDGKIFVAGGTNDENITPVYPAEMYDPQTNSWTDMASIRTFRGYHSTMVLLPDGRVVLAGSNGNPTAEIYSPPYLFRGARPSIDSWPLFVQYGQQFSVGTASAADIRSVVFMRPGASTHAINMEQRHIPLTYSQSGPGTLNVTSPIEPNIAPPGYYMMFILNSNGVPSVARWVQIGGAIVGNRRPNVDAGPSQAFVLPAVATLNGTVSDDGLPNPPGAVTVTWSATGPGPVVFGNEHAVDTTATFSVIGDYQLRLEADDDELIAADVVSISIGDGSTPAVSIEKRVAAGSDDAEEAVASRAVNLDGAGDLEMTDDEGVTQIVGMRFSALFIPQGAPIQNAWIQFRADELSSVFTNLTIQAQSVDNAPTFAAAIGNISGRARTSASVNWQPAPWLIQDEIGPGQRTPNLKTVIQEVVNRPGWSPGNSIVIIVSGTGKRVADSYEGWSVIAPLLHVDVGGGGPPPPPPVNHEPGVNAGPDRTIYLNQSASLDGTITDDGLPSPPGATTALWVKESGPGTVTFANPNAVDTTATFSVIGRYELQLIANDGEFTMTDSMAVQVNTPIPVNAMLDRRVSAGNGDSEERSNGNITLNSGSIEMVQDSTTQTVGYRFTSMTIPRGATIGRAYVQFRTHVVRTGATSLTIYGQSIDNAATFNTTRWNITNRTRTSASVGWTPPAWSIVGERGVAQRTPDLTAIIQQIVNRPGWVSGNSMALIITGSGVRSATSYEGGAGVAATLHVEWVQ